MVKQERFSGGFLTGILMGIVVGIFLAMAWTQNPTARASSAADSVGDLAVATGSVSEEADGLFVLDHQTGLLGCSVFNPAGGGFNVVFRRNVVADLQVPSLEDARFLMLTGDVEVPQRSSQSIGGCLVYVVDATSGVYAAYAVPWRRDLFASGRAQVGELALLKVGSVKELTGLQP